MLKSDLRPRTRTRREPSPIGAAILACSLLGIAVGIASVPANAQQQTNRSAYLDLSAYLIAPGNQVVPLQALSPTPASSGLSSTVIQTGQGNIASTTLSGSANITSQSQVGLNNSSTLAISGVQNSIVSSQIGNANTNAIQIAGNGNSVSNLQIGSGLSYQLQVVGTAAPVSVQQFGRK